MNHKIKNLDKVADRIRKAAEGKEKIIIYADSDCDGICSAVIMKEAIGALGGVVNTVMFPDRELDGYGLNLRALEMLKTAEPALFITLDLGITNNKEIALANELGLEVIVVDHHEPPAILPPASLIVDPKQPGDNSGLTYLCNAGITFKLAEKMLAENFSGNIENSFLELTALATISDMMAQIEENKTIIEYGLRSLPTTTRPGLQAFLGILGRGDLPRGQASVAAGGSAKIISALNAGESIDFHNPVFDLLISTDVRTCRDLAEMLVGRVRIKQQKIQQIAEEVERRIAHNPEPIIFEGDPAWKLTLAGPVASIIAQKYNKPTFIYKKMDTDSTGSVRSLKEGQSSVEAMRSCQDILITYGGHPKASGFRIKNENLEKFKQGLAAYFQNHG